MSADIPRYVLGTAQLGMEYGVANLAGRPDARRAAEIVKAAWDGGARVFDTAQGYGDSERHLGAALAAHGWVSRARVVTKLTGHADPRAMDWIAGAVGQSRERLGMAQLWGLMLHRADWLVHLDGGLGRELRRLRAAGHVRFLGVSVYTVAEAEAALRHPDMDILQVPCNVWDQRMQTGGVFAEARRRGKICFVRSIFLQGLLTLPREEVARRVPAATAAAAAWDELVREHGCSAVELAARYAVASECPLVIGADSPRQAADNGALLALAPLAREAAAEIRARMAPHLSEEVIDPSRWPAG